jgi:hypothetical protein
MLYGIIFLEISADSTKIFKIWRGEGEIRIITDIIVV